MDEKRQLLNFVFQNLKLNGKNLSIETCEPFTILVEYKEGPIHGYLNNSCYAITAVATA